MRFYHGRSQKLCLGGTIYEKNKFSNAHTSNLIKNYKIFQGYKNDEYFEDC